MVREIICFEVIMWLIAFKQLLTSIFQMFCNPVGQPFYSKGTVKRSCHCQSCTLRGYVILCCFAIFVVGGGGGVQTGTTQSVYQHKERVSKNSSTQRVRQKSKMKPKMSPQNYLLFVLLIMRLLFFSSSSFPLQNQLVVQGVPQPSVVIETSEKAIEVDSHEVQPSPLPPLRQLLSIIIKCCVALLLFLSSITY